MIRITKAEYYPLSFNDIERVYCNCYKYYVKIGNEHACIISNRELSPYDYNTVICKTETEVPLWKQDMQIRMGRRPTPTVQNQTTMRTYSIPEARIHSFKYFIFKETY